MSIVETLEDDEAVLSSSPLVRGSYQSFLFSSFLSNRNEAPDLLHESHEFYHRSAVSSARLDVSLSISSVRFDGVFGEVHRGKKQRKNVPTS